MDRSRCSTAGAKALSMRTILVMLTVTLWASLVTADDATNRERAFVRALEMFNAAENPEQYREAAKEFEAILADGF